MLDNELELTIQACQILDGENEKLKAHIVELEQALISHKRGWQASVERNNELKAQVEQLQHRVIDTSSANKLSGKCLYEIKAQAGRDGYAEALRANSIDLGIADRPDMITWIVEQYANQRRQQDNTGE